MDTSQDRLKLIESNVRDELKNLEGNLQQIMGIESLMTLQKSIKSADILRKLIIEEVRIMYQDTQKELTKFSQKLDNIFGHHNSKLDFHIELIKSEQDERQDHFRVKPIEPHLSTPEVSEAEYVLEPCSIEGTSTNDISLNTLAKDTVVELDLPLKEEICETTPECSSDEDSHRKIKLITRYKCGECPEAFCSNVELRRHRKIEHDLDGAQCSICMRRFSNITLMDEHYRSHTGERPFKCENCGKTFARKTSFRVHQRIHSQERPFVCEVCGKSFRCKQHVQGHAISHTRERNYICSICGKTFMRPQNLSRHVKIHTRGEDGEKARKKRRQS